jgi:hypothetical protein
MGIVCVCVVDTYFVFCLLNIPEHRIFIWGWNVIVNDSKLCPMGTRGITVLPFVIFYCIITIMKLYRAVLFEVSHLLNPFSDLNYFLETYPFLITGNISNMYRHIYRHAHTHTYYKDIQNTQVLINISWNPV